MFFSTSKSDLAYYNAGVEAVNLKGAMLQTRFLTIFPHFQFPTEDSWLCLCRAPTSVNTCASDFATKADPANSPNSAPKQIQYSEDYFYNLGPRLTISPPRLLLSVDVSASDPATACRCTCLNSTAQHRRPQPQMLECLFCPTPK
jgi:hypothetical protein